MAEWLVLSLFTEGRISSGKAANLLNLSRVEFLAFLRNRGIAYLNYTPTELAEEFAVVDSLEVKQLEIADYWGNRSLEEIHNQVVAWNNRRS